MFAKRSSMYEGKKLGFRSLRIKCKSMNGTNFQQSAEQLLSLWEIGRLGAGMKKRLETGAADQFCPLWAEMEKVH